MGRSRLRSCRTRRSRFLFLSLFFFLLSLLTGIFAANQQDDGGAGGVEVVELEPPAAAGFEQPVPLERPLAAQASRTHGGYIMELLYMWRDWCLQRGIGLLRREIHLPTDLHPLKRRLVERSGSGSGAAVRQADAVCFGLVRTEVQLLHGWLDEMQRGGRASRGDLMKAVIAVTGEGYKFVDKEVPSTRTDLLRRTATQLNIGPSELRLLAQEVKGDPSLSKPSPRFDSPPKPESKRESKIFKEEMTGPHMPSPTTQVSTPPSVSPNITPSSSRSASPEPLEAEEGLSPPDSPQAREPAEALEEFKTPEPAESPKPSDRRKKLTLEIPPPPAAAAEGRKTGLDFSLPVPSESRWLAELEELLRGPSPPTPSPVQEEAPSFSPETQKLLASIPPLPGKPIPESTKELLEYSPYMGVASKWMPTLDEDSMADGSISSLLSKHGKDEPMDSLAREVDEIIAQLQEPTEAEVQMESKGTSTGTDFPEDPTTQGVRASTPVDREPGVEKKGEEGAKAEAPLLKEEEPIAEEAPQKTRSPSPSGGSDKSSSSPASTSDSSLMKTASPITSDEEVMLEKAPHLVDRPAREAGRRRERPGADDMALSSDFQEKRFRLWDRAKAAASEHKNTLKVTGGVLLGAAVIAGLVVLYRKLNRRIPSSSPLISKVEPKKCQVFFDFEKGRKLNGMGRVVSIEKVHVNNTKRTLTLEYLEKPALKCSRGSELFKWLKYRFTLGKSLVRRVESMPIPESCMAGPFSRFQVAEDDGAAKRLLVDLEMNPGLLTVPRELMEPEDLDELLENYGHDPSWKLYEDCVMHITIEKPFKGSPIVAVDTAGGRVGFLNEELTHLKSLLPKECDWREPSELRIAYKSTSNGEGPVELLLLMSAADPPLEETIVLEREPGEAALEDPDDVLEDIRTLFGE
ncbi:hypothetical protein, conserved [Eimeria brunetti]|uniref:Uncharacterized protein n=1 Tax=Eimeria brunetti TaxID=51314 RepID=U6LG87_9EIME|nr:hypothetical protein, conserved [Eimeria brunetti]